MANKITISGSLALSASKASPKMSFSVTFDQVGTHYTMETQDIGYADAEALDVGADIGTIGFLVLQNLDPDNIVDFALDEPMTNKIATLEPGHGTMLCPPAGATIYAQARVAACSIQFFAVQK